MSDTSSRIPVGTHLRVSRLGYDHHGVYVGWKMVVHYSGWASKFAKGKIEKTSLDKFCCAGKISRVVHPDALDKTLILANASSRLGENQYNLIFNNCEHFANWCVTGKHKSEQVRVFFVGTIGAKVFGLFD